MCWYLKRENYERGIQLLGIQEDTYLRLARLVDRHFSQSWVQASASPRMLVHPYLHPIRFETLPYHPIPVLLDGRYKGTDLIREIAYLGRLLAAYEEIGGSSRVISRLRDDDEYRGALFELEVLHFFLEDGYDLPVPPETDGVDYTFERDQQRLYVECTVRGPSRIVALRSEIMRRTSAVGGAHHAVGRKVIVGLVDYEYFNGEPAPTVLNEIAAKINLAEQGDLDEGFVDSAGLYRLDVEPANEGLVDFCWHPKPELEVLVWEAGVHVRNRLTDKLRQLQNSPSVCALDVRGLVADIASGAASDNFAISQRFLERCITECQAFVEHEPTVRGVLLWLRRVRLDSKPRELGEQIEVVAVGADEPASIRLAEVEFSFACAPSQLTWYSTEGH